MKIGEISTSYDEFIQNIKSFLLALDVLHLLRSYRNLLVIFIHQIDEKLAHRTTRQSVEVFSTNP